MNKDYAAIDLLSNCYLQEKRKLREYELGISHYSSYVINSSKKIVMTIEECAKFLDEQDRFIIVNEVIKGKKGHWYAQFMSESTYYRHRKQAYDSFLKNLNR